MSVVPEKLVEIQRLHAAYVRLTGLAISLDLAGYREMLWMGWMRMGFTEGDLAAVVLYVNRCIRRGERGFNFGTLKFNSLIGQPDRFDELLAEARAVGRKPEGRSRRAEILRATGRESEAALGNTQSAAAVVSKVACDPERLARALEEFRRENAKLNL